MIFMDYKVISKQITDWIKSYSDNSSTETLVVGVSGGVDSAVVSTLCAMTQKDVILVGMPIHQNMEQVNLAEKHIDNLKSRFGNVKYIEYDLTTVYDQFKSLDNLKLSDTEQFEFTLSNTRARLRMTTLYNVAGQTNGIVVGTGNKIEDFGIKFFTKYGDGGVDISPIGDLLKSEVYSLGRSIGVIDGILNSKPTDGLHDDGRTDEDQIGASYDELEWALMYSMGDDKRELTKREVEVLDIYNYRNESGKHKMEMPPVCDLWRWRLIEPFNKD